MEFVRPSSPSRRERAELMQLHFIYFIHEFPLKLLCEISVIWLLKI